MRSISIILRRAALRVNSSAHGNRSYTSYETHRLAGAVCSKMGSLATVLHNHAEYFRLIGEICRSCTITCKWYLIIACRPVRGGDTLSGSHHHVRFAHVLYSVHDIALGHRRGTEQWMHGCQIAAQVLVCHRCTSVIDELNSFKWALPAAWCPCLESNAFEEVLAQPRSRRC